MHMSKVFRLRLEYFGIGTIKKIGHRFQHNTFVMRCYRNANAIRRQTIFLFILSITFFLFMFFYTFVGSSKGLIPIENYQKNIGQNQTVRTTRAPVIFSKAKYYNQTRKPSENVICYLVASYVGEPRLAYNPYPRLREKVIQLDERLNDGNITDVIIFHTGYPLRSDILSIIEGSRRQVEFVNVDHIFYKFSPGFDPHATNPSWAQRGKWNYHHMCYFWFKQVFDLEIVQKYRYMMRLDDDSQIGEKWPNIFDIMAEKKAFYLANQREVDYEYVLPGLTLIRNLTVDYIAKNNITVQNPAMYEDIFNKTLEIPNFWNNLEIVDLSFMRRKDVVDFTKAVDESKGIFLYRWGDAPLRYATLALFVNESQILHRTKLGLNHCHPC